MVNYNTNELKVAMYNAPYEVNPLPAKSSRNVVAALTEAFDRRTNIVLVFVYCRHMLSVRTGHEIHNLIAARRGQIVSYNPALVIMTTHGKSITVYFIGGMGNFFAPAPDSSSEDSSDEVNAVIDSPSPMPPPRCQRTDATVAANATNNRATNNTNGSSNRTTTNNNNANRHQDDSDSSFEDTIGLTQELF
jgi:hypothetical protein